MGCKKFSAGRFTCAVAAGLVAFAPVAANAQDTTSSTTTTTTSTTTMSGDMSMQPMAMTGTVLRYYVDRAGYVTAMDVQTAEGVQFVRFSPGMGQRLYTQYPVGSNANFYVMGSPTTRLDVVSMTAPAAGMTLMPYMTTDVQALDSEPYIMAGAKMVTMSGSLKNIIANEMGEVVGLVLGVKSAAAAAEDTGAVTDKPLDKAVTDTMMNNMANDILVRVPREVRQIAPGYAGTNRVTPFFKGSNVEVTGYPEAPRFGVLSSYHNRIAATALVVNGRAVGALGVPLMNVKDSATLFKVDLGSTTRTAEETRAMGMGYSVYDPSGSMMMGAGTGTTTGSMGSGTMGGPSTGTTGSMGGTMGSGTMGNPAMPR